MPVSGSRTPERWTLTQTSNWLWWTVRCRPPKRSDVRVSAIGNGRGSSCVVGGSPVRGFVKGPVALERSPRRNPVRVGLDLPHVELLVLEPPAEACLVGVDRRPRDGHAFLPVVGRPLPTIPSVLQQFGQIPPEGLFRTENHRRNLRMGLSRGSRQGSFQARVIDGPEQDIGILRLGIDDPHGLALGHRLPLLGVQLDHGSPPTRSYRKERESGQRS